MTNLTGRNIEASITLRQKGVNGKITSDINLTPKGLPSIPAAHEAMAQLVALWLQVESMMDPAKEADGDNEYVSTLVLSQDDMEGPIYSKLTMNPRIKAEDKVFPSAYEASSYLSTAWLYMTGTIDEEGNLRNEEDLDYVELEAKEVRVH